MSARPLEHAVSPRCDAGDEIDRLGRGKVGEVVRAAVRVDGRAREGVARVGDASARVCRVGAEGVRAESESSKDDEDSEAEVGLSLC